MRLEDFIRKIECAPPETLTAADLRRAERELGYRPRVGIEEGIRHFVRWYEATHGRQS